MKNIIFKLLLIFCVNTLCSQGFLWNDEIKNYVDSTYQKVEITRSFVPSKYSLERFTPSIVSDQGPTSMCVAYALASCRTILYAKNKRITDRDQIFINSFSPFFIYYLNSFENDYSCSAGLLFYEAINYLRDNGIPKLLNVEYPDYWPFTEKVLCNEYPPDINSDIRNAKKFKIDAPKIIDTDNSDFTVISRIKSELAFGNPILFGMWMPISLLESYGKNYWTPRSYDKIGDMGHAMVIIGYDNNKYGGAFQILNSYGEDWGNDGKIWIKYNDLMPYLYFVCSISRKYEAFGSSNKDVTEIVIDKEIIHAVSPEFMKEREDLFNFTNKVIINE